MRPSSISPPPRLPRPRSDGSTSLRRRSRHLAECLAGAQLHLRTISLTKRSDSCWSPRIGYCSQLRGAQWTSCTFVTRRGAGFAKSTMGRHRAAGRLCSSWLGGRLASTGWIWIGQPAPATAPVSRGERVCLARQLETSAVRHRLQLSDHERLGNNPPFAGDLLKHEVVDIASAVS